MKNPLFDTIINRRDRRSLKWEHYSNKDVLPMWVADMDFKAPAPVIKALKDEVEFGVYGYTKANQDLEDLICDRLEKKYNWTIKRTAIVWLPGIVCALNLACRSIGQKDDSVLTTTPIYPPFLEAPGLSNRKLETFAINDEGKEYKFNQDLFKSNIHDKTKLFLLSNPHNPTGKVFQKDELLKIGSTCIQKDVVICSDEIHCDLILDQDKTHIPIASLDPEISDRTITLMAPSKTFNLPGLCCGMAIIENDKLRRKFEAERLGILPYVGNFGYTAAEAAYLHCEPWRLELIDYLRENRNYLQNRVNNEIPGIFIKNIESTYLAWINIKELKLDHPGRFFEKHGLGISDGRFFRGHGYIRLNFGCPRSILEEGLDRLQSAIESLQT